MQSVEKRRSCRYLMEETKNGIITYDHPMQRKEGQWNNEQKSLLIHSLAAGYIVPEVFGLQQNEQSVECISILDGKQRLTTIYAFTKDEFALSDKTPSVVVKERKRIINADGVAEFQTETTEYELAGKKFSDLDEKMQREIMEFEFTVVIISDCSDEEIEEQFYRLNNGTALTKDQKARVKLGDELAIFIDELESMDFFDKKCHFTVAQVKGGAIQTCILQTLMLLKEYDYKNMTKDETIKFAEWFRDNHTSSDLELCRDVFRRLDAIIPNRKKPYEWMRATSIPTFAYHVVKAERMGLSDEAYGACLLDLLDAYSPEHEYAQFCGQSTTSKTKTQGRVNYISNLLEKVRDNL